MQSKKSGFCCLRSIRAAHRIAVVPGGIRAAGQRRGKDDQFVGDPVPAPLSTPTTMVFATITEHRQLECQLVRGRLDDIPVFHRHERLGRRSSGQLFDRGAEGRALGLRLHQAIADEEFGHHHADGEGHQTSASRCRLTGLRIAWTGAPGPASQSFDSRLRPSMSLPLGVQLLDQVRDAAEGRVHRLDRSRARR